MHSGGSLQIWRDYLRTDARSIGIDIDERCIMMDDKGFEIWTSDQQAQGFRKGVTTTIRKIDVLLDDSGRMMEQQLVTFPDKVSELHPILNNYWQTYCC